MPRYFFHVQDGEEYPDLQGTELANLQAARLEAVRFAGALLNDKPEQFWNAGEWTMRVTDDAETPMFSLSFFATSDPLSGDGAS